jgi:hypothetical protein
MNIYNEVILKYSFPMSLNTTNDLTEEDKSQIIENEYIFVKNIITQILDEGSSYNDNNIFIIPRILYDLFFMMYHGIYNIKTDIPRYSFNINLVTYDAYCEKTNEYHDSISKQVYLLNEYILQQLDTIGYDYSSPNYIEYEKVARYIFNSMMAYSRGGVNEEIIDIYENNFEEINSIINEIIHLIITEHRMLMTRDATGPNSVFSASSFGEVVMSEMEKQSQQYSPSLLFFSSVIIISIIQQRLAPIFKNISILHVTIEEKVKQAINQFMDICKNKDSVIDVLRNSNIYKYYPLYKFTKVLDEDLMLQCVKIESVEGSGSQNKFILYRGSPDAIEGAVNEEMFRGKKVYREGYSVSYNTSLLNGYFTDSTACTYNYMMGDDSDDAYKHYYKIRRFNYGDDSDESNLFFIPPLHPYLQLSSYGEFWHARSKIFVGSQIQWLGTFAGIFAETKGMVGYSENFPDYLVSHLKLKRNASIDPDNVTQLAKANKINIMNKFNKFIKAHRYPILPYSYNVEKNITRKRARTSEIKRINQLPPFKKNGEPVSEKEIAQVLDYIRDDRWHPEDNLFGGRNRTYKKTRRSKRTRRSKKQKGRKKQKGQKIEGNNL